MTISTSTAPALVFGGSRGMGAAIVRRLAADGRPDEIAGLVSWLAGPDAGYMTGASLTIDGGWTA